MMMERGDNTGHSYVFSRSSVNGFGEDIKEIAGRTCDGDDDDEDGDEGDPDRSDNDEDDDDDDDDNDDTWCARGKGLKAD